MLLLISGYAKSYKEAQMYFMPALLLGLVPAIVPFLPGISLRSIVVLLPVANIAVAVKDILTGAFDWPMITLSWLVTAGATLWITRAGARFLLSERLITASDRDVVEAQGGLSLFERHVWRWFALLWGVLLIVNGYTGKLDVRESLPIWEREVTGFIEQRWGTTWRRFAALLLVGHPLPNQPKHFTAKLAKTAKRAKVCGSGLGPRMEIVRLAQTG